MAVAVAEAATVGPLTQSRTNTPLMVAETRRLLLPSNGGVEDGDDGLSLSALADEAA